MVPSPALPQDELFEVEWRIARRADELLRRNGSKPGQALHAWQIAEREIWNEWIKSHAAPDVRADKRQPAQREPQLVPDFCAA